MQAYNAVSRSRRRAVAAVALVLTGVWSRARAAGPPKRIGYLTTVKPSDSAEGITAFKEGMRDLGYVDGRDFTMDIRSADNQYDRLPALAKELVGLKPDLLLGVASAPIRALRDATSTIPIVSITAGDPVGAGFAKTLANPGGNITGLGNMNVDTDPKLLSILVRMSPRASPVALLYNPASSSAPGHRKSTQEAVRGAGGELVEFAAGSAKEIERAFEAMKAGRVAVLIVASDAFLVSQAALISGLALKAQLPAASQRVRFAEAGLLMSYGAGRLENSRRAARYVDRIFKGAKPAELAFELPTEFQLVINRRTAKALSIVLPDELVLSAHRIID